jgi:hypothetical protein
MVSCHRLTISFPFVERSTLPSPAPVYPDVIQENPLRGGKSLPKRYMVFGPTDQITHSQALPIG